jgi:hypothetical protein
MTLQVGDKVYQDLSNRHNEGVYRFYEVVKVTPKFAILNDGKKVIREGVSKNGKPDVFRVYGDRSVLFELVTDDVLTKYAKYQELEKAYYWFFNRKFSKDEKLMIYNYFKELGISETQAK